MNKIVRIYNNSLHCTCPRRRHRLWILHVGHHHRRYRQHETADDLFGVFADSRIGEADAGTVERHPGAPFQPHHQAAHAEDHSHHIHVIRR